jgi:hypothetical protein
MPESTKKILPRSRIECPKEERTIFKEAIKKLICFINNLSFHLYP